MKFNPKELCHSYKVTFTIEDLNLTIDTNNWPDNLIYNPNLIESDDMFYEEFCSDTTLTFYVESAIGRCKSLISRATHNPEAQWEHGDIHIIDIPGECKEHYMKRTRTNLAVREMKS
jgi:hypothetical protein